MFTQIELGDIKVDVVFKDIKNVHLSVHPPNGRVRIAAPMRMSPDTVRVFAISKLSWIRQQQEKIQAQERETPREYLDRESHYLWGKRYLLDVGSREPRQCREEALGLGPIPLVSPHRGILRRGRTEVVDIRPWGGTGPASRPYGVLNARTPTRIRSARIRSW